MPESQIWLPLPPLKEAEEAKEKDGEGAGDIGIGSFRGEAHNSAISTFGM